MKDFLKKEWFKLALIVLAIWFLYVLEDIADNGVWLHHSGRVNSNYEFLDGITIYDGH